MSDAPLTTTDQPQKPKKTRPQRRSIRNPLPAATIGRPTVYHPSFVELAYRLALLGQTDEEMAQFFGVHVTRIYEWDKKHSDFGQARARGKAPVDGEVAESLFKRAVGFTRKQVKIFPPTGRRKKAVKVEYEEYFPPDTQAATWWLKNRQSAKWKDQLVQVEHTGSVAITDGRQAQLRQKLLAELGDAAKPVPPTINEDGTDV